MLRFPSALGPHSLLPWYQPTILPSAMRFAVSSASDAPSGSRYDTPPRSSASLSLSGVSSGPQ